jgi:hypothetical protein
MRINQRAVAFRIERGSLVRTVSGANGRGYVQRAALKVLQEVALYVEAHAKDGTTTDELWDAFPGTPRTQLAVALDFLRERGCVIVRCRRSYPASSFVYEDAMIEYHALEA